MKSSKYAQLIKAVQSDRAVLEEVVLAYAETDSLSYQAEDKELKARQAAQWQPVIEFLQRRFDCSIHVTEGVMPVAQPEETLARLRKVVAACGDEKLAALVMLTQALGSLLLALAVMEKHLDGAEAFRLSRLEEDFQAEKWGVEESAAERAEKLRAEVMEAAKYVGRDT